METKQLALAIGKHLGQGFLFGLGFIVAVLLVAMVGQSMFTKAMTPKIDPASFLPDTKSITEKLVVSGVEEMKTGGQTYFIGLLTNKSDRVARGIHVEVDLFNKNKFVDQYSTYLSGSLAAGESQHFKINCGCKDNPPAEKQEFLRLRSRTSRSTASGCCSGTRSFSCRSPSFPGSSTRRWRSS